MDPAKALFWRTLADGRVRTLSFALLFAAYALVNGAGYTKAYPTAADRLDFAQSFGSNTARRLLYGTPHHLETLGGYVAWRVGGVAALVAAFVGLLAAVRALRSEEESGRAEIVAAGALSRESCFAARATALAAGFAILWLALLFGLVAGGLPWAGSAYLALAIVGAAAAYAGVGAVTSQLMSTGRGALELAGAVLGADLLVRVVADTAGLPALHWLLPLGWVEETRAFAGPRPVDLLLPAAGALVLFALAKELEQHRDLGTGLLPSRDTRRLSRTGRRFLRSPLLLALRSDWMSISIWAVGTGGFAFVLGTLSKNLVSANLGTLRQQIDKLGGGGFTTPSSVLGAYFLFFVLIVALFCCTQIGGIRDEEAAGRLEPLFALPESRTSWLGGRLTLAAGATLLVALVAGLGAALGALAAGASVSFGRLIEAGLNCLPASLLFLGLGVLLIALAPRLGVGVTYALVGLAFVWELVGALLSVPNWVLGISPFHQIGLVPAAAFRTAPAVVMLAIGVIASLAALARFRSRDLTGV